MEILAPVKNLANAKIAIVNGADAIYLASNNFGARVNASIDYEEIQQIIKIAKSYEVKTYITFNTVIFDDELENYFREIDKMYLLGVSGVIIQDISFIPIIKKYYPNLEVHCSTQMHIHNQNAIKLVKKLGSNRVVLPREMNFNRIKKIKDNIDIEVEIFAHGAICVSYSGQCYDSTLLDQKSANRGKCSQYCRMEQKVYHQKLEKPINPNPLALNLKDMNNSKNLAAYQDAKIDSLKIEGRLKGIDYVGLTTKTYKENLLNIKKRYDKQDNLATVYNRSFTTGRIDGKNGAEIVNQIRPNNMGQLVGTIVEVLPNLDKKTSYYKYLIKIKTLANLTLHKGDNLRYIYHQLETGQEIQKMEKINSQEYLIYSNQKIKVGEVYRTKNIKLIENYQEVIKDLVSKKQIIEIDLTINTRGIFYNLTSEQKEYQSLIIPEQAQKRALVQEDVKKQLKKTGEKDFQIKINSLNLAAQTFLPVSSLKKLRDEIITNYEKLIPKLQSKITDVLEELELEKHQELKKEKISATKTKKQYYIQIKTMEQFTYFLNNSKKVFKDLINKEINLIIEMNLAVKILENIEDLKKLKNLYKLFLATPKIIYDDTEEQILKIIPFFDNLVINEIGSLKYQKFIKGEIITGYTFNTTNFINQTFLKNQKISKQILSIEMNEQKISNFKNDAILNIYGRVPIMIMDYCPINLKKTNTCGTCKRCHKGEYYLKDNLQRKFPLMYEGNYKIGLYSNKPISLFDEISNEQNINNYYLALSLETTEDIELILNSIKRNKNYINNSFVGNYNKEVL